MKNSIITILITVTFIFLQSSIILATDNSTMEKLKEPKGLRLHHYDYSSNKKFIKWKTTKQEVDAKTGASGMSSCFDVPKKEGVELCSYSDWLADFGKKASARYDVRLYFYKEHFFKYRLEFKEWAFDFTYNTIKAKLGEPTSEKSTVVQNRMGAEFNQDYLKWKTENVSVFLQRRNSSDLTESSLIVTYLPISKQIPEEEVGGDASF